jgi:hypothetical protein
LSVGKEYNRLPTNYDQCEPGLKLASLKKALICLQYFIYEFLGILPIEAYVCYSVMKRLIGGFGNRKRQGQGKKLLFCIRANWKNTLLYNTITKLCLSLKSACWELWFCLCWLLKEDWRGNVKETGMQEVEDKTFFGESVIPGVLNR